MNITKVMTLALLAIAAAGCTHVGNVAPPSTDQIGSDTYFVMGIEPANVSVSFETGVVEGGLFKTGIEIFAAYAGGPEDGYIVGKIKGGDALAITNVRLHSSEHDLFPAMFVPCNGTKTVVFTALPGKVLYLAHARYERQGSGVAPHYWSDIDAALAFMKAHYPKLADRLEPAKTQMMSATSPFCAH
jgi:hypothetical protein